MVWSPLRRICQFSEGSPPTTLEAELLIEGPGRRQVLDRETDRERSQFHFLPSLGPAASVVAAVAVVLVVVVAAIVGVVVALVVVVVVAAVVGVVMALVRTAAPRAGE